MRIVDTIPHPEFRISILKMNDKWLLRIEAGPYEQVYKFTTEMASDTDEIKRLASPEFLAQVKVQFDAMHGIFLPAVRTLKGR
ncbi:MAG: hypothetical protein ACO3AF_07240 [Flavobacteriales bacterium]